MYKDKTLSEKGEYMYADENVIKVKHEVLYEVAKATFEGQLEQKRDDIPFKIIPGPTPQFRCCIYKERAVVRYRIMALAGYTLETEDDEYRSLSSFMEEAMEEEQEELQERLE